MKIKKEVYILETLDGGFRPVTKAEFEQRKSSIYAIEADSTMGTTVYILPLFAPFGVTEQRANELVDKYVKFVNGLMGICEDEDEIENDETIEI